MVNIIIQLSKYVIIILMAAYTFSCFSIFTRNYEDEEKRVLIRQDVLMFLLQFAAFGTMYLATKDIRILFLYAVLTVILLAVILLYNLIYPNVSRLVVNNMCMLITVGMIMITRSVSLRHGGKTACICCFGNYLWTCCSGFDPKNEVP